MLKCGQRGNFKYTFGSISDTEKETNDGNNLVMGQCPFCKSNNKIGDMICKACGEKIIENNLSFNKGEE